jgi:hypothetical protein
MVLNLELRFHPDEKDELCKQDFTKSDKPIVYYKRDPHYYLYYGKKYFSITYYMYYKFNYAIGFNGIFPKVELFGYHPIDLELIRIIYNIKTLQPEYIFFSAHSQEGIWVKYSECEFNNTNLVVYVALNSHAMKPHNGTYFRIFGTSNDYYSKQGKKIIPELIEDNTLEYKTLQNREVFTSFYKRFLLPFYEKNKQDFKKLQKLEEENNNKNII